jgi:hypothetical protein
MKKMPSSDKAVRITLEIPYSECAMHCGIAGKTLTVIEEDRFSNGQVIPNERRYGCYAIDDNGARIPMLKSEAGWRE